MLAADIVETATNLGFDFGSTLAALAKPSVVLDLTNDDGECSPLQSRLGGRPVLPKSEMWPRKNGKPLACVAQINLSEVAVVCNFDELPSSGLLTFFFEADAQPWGLSPTDRDSFAVRYASAPLGDMTVADWPDDLPESERFADNGVTFRQTLTLPSAGSNAITQLKLTPKQFEAYEQLLSEVSDDLNRGSRSLLLGHPDQIQLGDMFEFLPLVTAGIPIGGRIEDNSRTRELRSRAKDWRLLFQVESLETSNMIWGSMGLLYFCITEQALRGNEFDAAWIALQCD